MPAILVLRYQTAAPFLLLHLEPAWTAHYVPPRGASSFDSKRQALLYQLRALFATTISVSPIDLPLP